MDRWVEDVCEVSSNIMAGCKYEKFGEGSEVRWTGETQETPGECV